MENQTRREFVSRGLKGLAFVAFGSYFIGCDKIEEWCDKETKKIYQREYALLEKYINGTTTFMPKENRGYWSYINEDLRNNPELRKMLEKDIDKHSLAKVYRTLNDGKDPIAKLECKRPVWNFENYKK